MTHSWISRVHIFFWKFYQQQKFLMIIISSNWGAMLSMGCMLNVSISEWNFIGLKPTEFKAKSIELMATFDWLEKLSGRRCRWHASLLTPQSKSCQGLINVGVKQGHVAWAVSVLARICALFECRISSLNCLKSNTSYKVCLTKAVSRFSFNGQNSRGHCPLTYSRVQATWLT